MRENEQQKTAEAVEGPIPCRRDCAYFSTYTNTCDYTLLMYHTRGCPTGACTRYKKQTKPRPWSHISYDQEDGLYISVKEEKSVYIPEPPLDPTDDGLFITADCGHEVFEDEELFEWENGKTLCPDCLEDKFRELSILERADLMGCEHRTVHFHKTSLN